MFCACDLQSVVGAVEVPWFGILIQALHPCAACAYNIVPRRRIPALHGLALVVTRDLLVFVLGPLRRLFSTIGMRSPP